MGYMNMDNLYKNQDILLFKECYALEKIHGTSAHIRWADNMVHFFSGGEKRENFIALFDADKLAEGFKAIGRDTVIINGEAYGGKQQGMSDTYGKQLKFIVFEVNIGGNWLSVPEAEQIAIGLGLEFVHYKKITTDLQSIDAERDADSVQAVRNGMGEGKKREGVVLRPLIELRKNNGARIICKHKREDFRETKKQREVTDPAKLEVLKEAQAIAEEWVTEMRLTHVLDAFPDATIENTPDVIRAMIADVLKESVGEIVDSKEARKAIGSRTAQMFKKRFQDSLKNA